MFKVVFVLLAMFGVYIGIGMVMPSLFVQGFMISTYKIEWIYPILLCVGLLGLKVK